MHAVWQKKYKTFSGNFIGFSGAISKVAKMLLLVTKITKLLSSFMLGNIGTK